MYKTEFLRIAKKENGTFNFKEETIDIGFGERQPNLIYQIKFKYKDSEIIINNKTGIAFIGTMVCKFPKSTQSIPFTIETTSHFLNLFFRRKSRFKIQCNNKNLTYFIKNNNAFKALNNIANKVDFNPTIAIESEKRKEIITRYHLEFEDWMQVLEPLIEFNKNIVDELDNRIANISSYEYQKTTTHKTLN